MPLKTIDRRNIKPHTVKDSYKIYDDGDNVDYGVIRFISTNISLLSEDAWYSFLTSFDDTGMDKINPYLVDTYGNRVLQPDIMRLFSGWEYNDYITLMSIINKRTTNVLLKNREKYRKLYEAMTTEFNPLWNVDGTEVTERTLAKEGDITNDHDGKDKVIKDGTDTYRKFGDETSTESGHTITDHTGTDTYVDTGSEDNTRTGSRDVTTTGGEIDTRYKGTTDNVSLMQVEQNVKKYDDGANQHNTKEVETFTNLKDTKTFTNRQNQRTADLTDDVEHGKTITNSFDQRYDEQEYDSSTETQYDSSNKETFDTLDSENITVTRQGNIGVTTTTKLLTEYVDYALYFDFIDIVCKDCLNAFTIGIYD